MFIAYIIVPALLLYEVSDEAGAFAAIRLGIEAITPNDLLHVMEFRFCNPISIRTDIVAPRPR